MSNALQVSCGLAVREPCLRSEGCQCAFEQGLELLTSPRAPWLVRATALGINAHCFPQCVFTNMCNCVM